MGAVDFASGIQAELLRRAAAQAQAAEFAERVRHTREQEVMQRKVFESNEELKRAQLDATTDARKAAEHDRQVGLASSLADQIPAGQFVGEDDPIVGLLRTGGRGALLQPQDERPAIAEGPLMPNDTGAARPKGFIKTASANQANTIADNERAAAAEKRAAETAAATAGRQKDVDTETHRHNVAMENKPTGQSGMGFVVVQTPTGYQVVDKRTGTSKAITGEDGGALPLAPTTQDRNTSKAYQRAEPILNGISELSEKINVNQGLAAKAIGEAERQKAKMNLNDDVAEYEAMISGFTPLIARSLGHTGVLTEQDVQSVKALFPRPGDSKSLRDRKVARIKTLMGQLEGGGAETAAPDQTQTTKPTAADLLKKYGGR